MLVRVLTPCPSVYLSQVGVLWKRLDESSSIIAFFRLSYTVLKGKWGIFKNKGTSLWNFVPNFGLREFCFGISIVETCCRFSSTKGGRSEGDKLDSRRSTKLTVSPSSDARPLEFITGDRQALSTARYSRAGQLATADTCKLSDSSNSSSSLKHAAEQLHNNTTTTTVSQSLYRSTCVSRRLQLRTG